MPRIDMLQDKFQSRGEWRVGGMGIEAIRYLVRRVGLRAQRDRARRAGESARIFTNKENEGRVEVQHLPVMTAFGELRGAVGTQFGQPQDGGRQS